MPGQYAGSRLYKEMHSMPRSTVQELYRQIALPVISAPMFIVSGPELVIAQCASGIIGSMPALNARPQGVLTQWLTQIRSEEHPSELQSLMRNSYAVFCLKKKNQSSAAKN